MRQKQNRITTIEIYKQIFKNETVEQLKRMITTESDINIMAQQYQCKIKQ